MEKFQVTILVPGMLSRLEKERALLETNEESAKYGLVLSVDQAYELASLNEDDLKQYGRTEIGSGILPKIIEAVSRSSSIWPANYAEILGELLEAFYIIKEDTLDRIHDDTVIESLADALDRGFVTANDILKD